MTKYLEREMAGPVDTALKAMPAVVLTGMRQVGKSTMLMKHRSFARRRYVTLDDMGSLEDAKRDPEAFVRSDVPMTIDEVQRAPELLVAVKREVDRRRKPGWFLLSGSANLALMRGASESLAGRAIYLELSPFTRRETRRAAVSTPYLRRLFENGEPPKGEGIPVTLQEIQQGGMPPVIMGPDKNRELWLRGFVQTYIERDVRQLSQVADLVAFQRLMRLAALRTGQIMEVGELAKDAQISVPTASRYLNLLETSYISRAVRPYLSNRTSRLIKSPKFFFTDSGIACHLWGLNSVVQMKGDPRVGALIETYTGQNISAMLCAHWPEAELCFWGVQGRYEVDFIVEAGRDCLAIEVKAAESWKSRDLAGLSAFLDKTPHCRAGILAYNGKEIRRLGSRLWAIPIGLVIG